MFLYYYLQENGITNYDLSTLKTVEKMREEHDFLKFVRFKEYLLRSCKLQQSDEPSDLITFVYQYAINEAKNIIIDKLKINNNDTNIYLLRMIDILNKKVNVEKKGYDKVTKLFFDDLKTRNAFIKLANYFNLLDNEVIKFIVDMDEKNFS